MGKRKTLLTIAAALALAAGTWLILDQGAEQPARPDPVDRVAQAWQRMVRTGLRMAGTEGRPEPWPFSSLERVSGGMPPRLRAEAREVLGSPGPLRLRFARARRGRAPNGVGVWVVPGRGVACMFRALGIASSCSPLAYAQRHGLILQSQERAPGAAGGWGRFVALGIAPDGARTVSVRSGRRSRSVAVVDNTFALEAQAPIQVVGFNP